MLASPNSTTQITAYALLNTPDGRKLANATARLNALAAIQDAMGLGEEAAEVEAAVGVPADVEWRLIGGLERSGNARRGAGANHCD